MPVRIMDYMNFGDIFDNTQTGTPKNDLVFLNGGTNGLARTAAGDDIVVVDAGFATIKTGAGHDIIKFVWTGLGNSVVQDFQHGRDVLDFSSLAHLNTPSGQGWYDTNLDGKFNRADLSFLQVDDFTWNINFRFGGTVTVHNNHGLTLAQVKDKANFDFGSSIITDWDGTNPLRTVGTSGNDLLAGSLLSDVIVGGDGNDVANGSDGNDTLRGQKGKDILSDGAGADQLFGGGGGDNFFICRDSSEDMILDFQKLDAIVMESGGDFSLVDLLFNAINNHQVNITTPDGDLTQVYSQTVQITAGDVEARTVVASDFEEVLFGTYLRF